MSEKKKSVLLVDDDVDFVEVNKLFLEQEGYEILTAHNSKECMKILQKQHPDAIVVDVMMDYKSEGFDLARDLRHSETYKNIPLIMMTSVNSEFPYDFEPHGTWLPVDVFLEKPVSSDTLIDVLNKQLDSGQ